MHNQGVSKLTNVLFICRDSYDAKFILSELIIRGTDYRVSVIIEAGGKAKKKKLRRIFKDSSLSNKIKSFVDLSFLVIYHFYMMKCIKAGLGTQAYPPQLSLIGRIDDINDENISSLIARCNPDVILNYGTALYKKETLSMIGREIFNIHSSVLPFYRNVHSDFWAYMNKDFAKIGVTIFKIDSGVDSGNIVIQRINMKASVSSLCEIKSQNLMIIVDLIDEFIHLTADKLFTSGKMQSNNMGSSYPTPTTLDLLKLFFR